MKNTVYKTILARRSIRDYQDRKVEHEKIDLMLKAAMAAPSACNLQPWAFVVVDENDQLEKLKEITGQGKYNAPLAIVILGLGSHIPWDGNGYQLDCGMAAQNLMLEATELELASVCIGGFEEEDLRKLLELPDEVEPICIIEVGYPSYTRDPLTWYTEEAVYWQKFDKDRPRTMRTMKMLSEDIASGKI